MSTPLFCLIGASWSLRGFTPENADCRTDESLPGDVRFTDRWNLPFISYSKGGAGNLELVEWAKEKVTDPALPILLVWVEPARDCGRFLGKDPNSWMLEEDAFEIRQDLAKQTLYQIRKTLSNPIAIIAADDFDEIDIAKELDIAVIHNSWQRWIADKINYTDFTIGWGAADVIWKMHEKQIKKPSKKIVFECAKWMQFCKAAELTGYMHRYHPTPKAHKEYGEFIKPMVLDWLNLINKNNV